MDKSHSRRPKTNIEPLRTLLEQYMVPCGGPSRRGTHIRFSVIKDWFPEGYDPRRPAKRSTMHQTIQVSRTSAPSSDSTHFTQIGFGLKSSLEHQSSSASLLRLRSTPHSDSIQLDGCLPTTTSYPHVEDGEESRPPAVWRPRKRKRVVNDDDSQEATGAEAEERGRQRNVDHEKSNQEIKNELREQRRQKRKEEIKQRLIKEAKQEFEQENNDLEQEALQELIRDLEQGKEVDTNPDPLWRRYLAFSLSNHVSSGGA